MGDSSTLLRQRSRFSLAIGCRGPRALNLVMGYSEFNLFSLDTYASETKVYEKVVHAVLNIINIVHVL